MDTEHDLEASCLGKQEYPSESAALAARRFMIRHGLAGHTGSLDVYPCRFGEHWHLGNLRPAFRPGRRKGAKRTKTVFQPPKTGETGKRPEMPQDGFRGTEGAENKTTRVNAIFPGRERAFYGAA